VRGCELTWGVTDLTQFKSEYDIILACEVIYEAELVQPLLDTLLALSGPETTIILAYDCRGTDPTPDLTLDALTGCCAPLSHCWCSLTQLCPSLTLLCPSLTLLCPGRVGVKEFFKRAAELFELSEVPDCELHPQFVFNKVKITEMRLLK
jgi:hypothetical protein